MFVCMSSNIRYDREFNMGSKAECDQLNLAQFMRRQCVVNVLHRYDKHENKIPRQHFKVFCGEHDQNVSCFRMALIDLIVVIKINL